MPNPLVFLVGCPRSGTTLLKRMVDAHEAIAIPDESHWIPRLYRRKDVIGERDEVSPGIVDILASDRRFPRFGIDPAELSQRIAARPGMRYGDMVTMMFDCYAQRRGKIHAGDKTPGYVACIPLLHQLFPSARFVHIIRDGRDVCLSSLNWSRAYKNAGVLAGYQEDPVIVTAFWWERYVSLGMEYGAELGPDYYLELRYESLVRDPEVECRRLCNFLDLPWDPAMLHYNQGVARKDCSTSNRAWMPPTQGLRDWRNQLSTEDGLRFEAAAGDLLSSLGYERRFKQIPQEQRIAAQLRRDAVRNALGKRPCPRSWD